MKMTDKIKTDKTPTEQLPTDLLIYDWNKFEVGKISIAELMSTVIENMIEKLTELKAKDIFQRSHVGIITDDVVSSNVCDDITKQLYKMRDSRGLGWLYYILLAAIQSSANKLDCSITITADDDKVADVDSYILEVTNYEKKECTMDERIDEIIELYKNMRIAQGDKCYKYNDDNTKNTNMNDAVAAMYSIMRAKY